MAEYERRTVVSTRYEWAVPAAPPHGAHISEVEKAVQAASAQAAPAGAPPDDLWVTAGEDRDGRPEIIIGFTVEEQE